MLKTRTREARFFALCLDTGQPCVIDNTSPTVAERAPFVAAAKARGFRAVAYFFDVPVKEALARNAARTGKRIPVPGIFRTAMILEPPAPSEGFDEVHRVQLVDGRFVVTSQQ